MTRYTVRLALLLATVSFASAPAEARFLQTDPVGYGPDLNLYTYVGNDPTNREDRLGLCDDVTGCNVQVQRQLSTPEAQRAQVVTMAVGAPLMVAGGAAVASSPAAMAVGLSAGIGGAFSAGASAARGNSNAQVIIDSANGMASSAITTTGGILGGIGFAGKAGELSGEITGAYAGAKATGASDPQATLSAVAAGSIGLLTMPAGSVSSEAAASFAGTAMKTFVTEGAQSVVTEGAQRKSTQQSSQSNQGNQSQNARPSVCSPNKGGCGPGGSFTVIP